MVGGSGGIRGDRGGSFGIEGTKPRFPDFCDMADRVEKVPALPPHDRIYHLVAQGQTEGHHLMWRVCRIWITAKAGKR
jgi:hypothetical protein